jgi:hypothetical protein
VLNVHIGDCLLQLPKFLQQKDKFSRNTQFQQWTKAWNKAYNAKVPSQDVESLPRSMLPVIQEMADEDVTVLEGIYEGHDLFFDVSTNFEHLSSSIARSNIQIEAFVTAAVKAAPRKNRIELLNHVTNGDHGGYDDEAVLQIVLNGIQFNSHYGEQLPPQFASVMRQRGIWRFETESRDLVHIRGFVYAYETYFMRRIRDSATLSRLLRY